MDAKQRIRELMAQRQWSEYRLAIASGLSQSTIAEIPRPRLRRLKAFVRLSASRLRSFFLMAKWLSLRPNSGKCFLRGHLSPRIRKRRSVI